MFLMPGLIIACYITGTLDTVLSAEHRKEMIRYLGNHQNEDGGFGLHIEGTSTMFGTGLSYVSLRILGVSPDDSVAQRARSWVRATQNWRVHGD
jgi:cycloartenol synthase